MEYTNKATSSRVVSHCLQNDSDYMDGQIRRIFITGQEFKLEDKIFHEKISIRLTNNDVDLEIKNCDFSNDLAVLSSSERDFDYSVFIFRTRIEGQLNLAFGDAERNISLDSCHLTELHVSGKCKKIDLFKTTIGLFTAEYCKCQEFEVSNSTIDRYSLFKFDSHEVVFDTDDLAIGDMGKFKTRSGQTLKEVSEVYHRLVLKSARSIKASARVNYQLTKATSKPVLAIFGYFFKPFVVKFWMVLFVVLYALLYKCVSNESFSVLLYFSSYTFLTVGYGDLSDHDNSLLKTILVFSEGVLGVIYSAALLVSIMNSSKK